MTSFNEIMNRDHRTTQSLRKRVKNFIDFQAQLSDKNYSEILMQNCDDCHAKTKQRSNLFARCNRNFMSKLLNYFSVFVYCIGNPKCWADH